MSEDRNELIDLNKLTERELLILLNHKVNQMEETIERVEKAQDDMALKVNSIETKSRVWAGVVGFFTGIMALIIERLIR